MGASLQGLRDHILSWPFLKLPGGRESAPEPQEPRVDAAFRFKECEGDCGPSAAEIEAHERERGERFKRDQLLPIMGMVGPPI